jgi:hypothetical protein
MVRALMLMDLHGWTHETAFVRYLAEYPDLVAALGFEEIPDQSTLWRARHERFSDELLQSITDCVVSIRVLAGEHHVSVPPRKTDLSELAAMLDIPRSTLSYRLRRAEAEFAKQFVAADQPLDALSPTV